jgi:hypothetical protein
MKWLLIILCIIIIFLIFKNFDKCTKDSDNCHLKEGMCIGEYLSQKMEMFKQQKCFSISFKTNLNIHIIGIVIFIIYTILLFSLYDSISTVTGNKIFVFFYCITLIAFIGTMYCVPYIPYFLYNILTNCLCLLGALLIPLLIIFFGVVIWKILEFFGFTISAINGVLLIIGIFVIYLFISDIREQSVLEFTKSSTSMFKVLRIFDL